MSFQNDVAARRCSLGLTRDDVLIQIFSSYMLTSDVPKKEILNDAYYSVGEVCEALGLTRCTVYDLVKAGLKTTQLRGKGKHFIKGSDLRALMVSNRSAHNGIV